jgi:hypothetical protein
VTVLVSVKHIIIGFLLIFLPGLLVALAFTPLRRQQHRSDPVILSSWFPFGCIFSRAREGCYDRGCHLAREDERECGLLPKGLVIEKFCCGQLCSVVLPWESP